MPIPTVPRSKISISIRSIPSPSSPQAKKDAKGVLLCLYDKKM